MNIMQIIPRLDSGGAERTTIEIAQAIIKAGGNAYILTEGGRMAEFARHLGAHIIYLPVQSKNPVILVQNIKKMIDLIHRYKIQILHARSRAPAWSAYLAGKIAKTVFLTTYHGSYRSGNSLKRFYNSVMVRGKYVIANSEFIKNLILEEYESFSSFQKISEKINVIPRGVDPVLFDLKRVSKTACLSLRKQWLGERDYGQAIWLLPGRLTSWKGQDIAIKAFSILCQSLKGEKKRETEILASTPHLVLLGDDQGRKTFKSQLEQFVFEMGLSNHVSFQPHRSDVFTAYAISDLVLSPSTRPEAFGRVAIEAQSMQKPVIVSDHGGARETVIHHHTGWRVQPGNVEDLANRMQEIIHMNHSEYTDFGKHARKYIEEKYTLESMQQKTLSVYRKSLA